MISLSLVLLLFSVGTTNKSKPIIVVNAEARGGKTIERKHDRETLKQAEIILDTNACIASGGDEETCQQEAQRKTSSSGGSLYAEKYGTTIASYEEIVGTLDLGDKQEISGDQKYEVAKAIYDIVDYYNNELQIDPKYKEVRNNCKFRHKLCVFWAVLGECTANPAYMEKDCALACKSCIKLDHNYRCPMNQTVLDTSIWKTPGGGDLNNMFERIAYGDEFQKYSPTILSKPKKKKDDDASSESDSAATTTINDEDNKNNKISSKSAYDDDDDDSVPENANAADTTASSTSTGDDDNNEIDGPWVIVLEDFLSEKECQTLIELGYEEGYERSADVGKKKFDGTFEQNVNDGRTSLNAWCKEDVCYKNDTAVDIMKRLEYLTKIPERNSEHFQILKYEVGEFYQQHHDYIHYQRDRQQGVRLITVFLYLNDVEQGGGTHFNQLPNLSIDGLTYTKNNPYDETRTKGLTVYPKRGRVLIWPSVKDTNPNDKDGRTTHEALPVEAGTKFGANAWIHLRDYKTAYENGCQ